MIVPTRERPVPPAPAKSVDTNHTPPQMMLRTVRNDAGELHNEHGPAVVWPGKQKMWYLHDKLSNINGPAILHENGERAWFLAGIQYTEKGWNRLVAKLKESGVPGFELAKDS